MSTTVTSARLDYNFISVVMLGGQQEITHQQTRAVTARESQWQSERTLIRFMATAVSSRPPATARQYFGRELAPAGKARASCHTVMCKSLSKPSQVQRELTSAAADPRQGNGRH